MSAFIHKTPEEHTAFWARKLHERAARLHRLTMLNAPAFILASERKLVIEAVARIPVAAEHLLMHDNISESMRHEQEQFLRNHGFYDQEDHE